MNEELALLYPATKIGHWPTGAVPVCDKHANALINIGAALGMHVPISDPAPAGSACTNCINEAKARKP